MLGLSSVLDGRLRSAHDQMVVDVVGSPQEVRDSARSSSKAESDVDAISYLGLSLTLASVSEKRERERRERD